MNLRIGGILGALMLWCLPVGILQATAFEQLEVDVPDPDVELINGAEPTSPAEWPATVIFRSPGGGCTSTAVGSKVIITAAHCIDNGDTGRVRLGSSNVNVRCDHHPGYTAGNRTTDFALCLVTDGELQGVAFEIIGASIAHPRVGTQVILSGYGCTTEGGQDHNFGVLHIGAAVVNRRPVGTDIDTVTKGGAALCFGDSGGAAYFLTDQDGSRIIVGINSRGDISTRSWLSTTATPQFVDWAVEWAAQHSVTICGLHVDANGCR